MEEPSSEGKMEEVVENISRGGTTRDRWDVGAEGDELG